MRDFKFNQAFKFKFYEWKIVGKIFYQQHFQCYYKFLFYFVSFVMIYYYKFN